MTTIRVVARFRPVTAREKHEAQAKVWSDAASCPVWVDDEHLLEYNEKDNADRVGTEVQCMQSDQGANKFTFDSILVWVNQEMTFRKIGLPVVLDALQGINGTILAYGQTGAGKHSLCLDLNH